MELIDNLNYWKFCINNINCSCINKDNNNKFYTCKYGILYHLIELLELHEKFNDLNILGKFYKKKKKFFFRKIFFFF
jgi:hypothetical protein